MRKKELNKENYKTYLLYALNNKGSTLFYDEWIKQKGLLKYSGGKNGKF